jgi:4-diphosphocytidyl-2C-methyl-D-erythritol kinase
MTGTGSAVFGLFNTFDDARRASKSLSKEYHETFWAKPVKSIF